jgi:hypothetical protein
MAAFGAPESALAERVTCRLLDLLGLLGRN